MAGRTHSDKTKMMMCIKRKGHPGTKHTESSKMKMSKISKERLKDKSNHPMFNKTQSEQAKHKMSVAKIGMYDGGENPRAKKLKFNGEVFDCIKDASKNFQIPYHVILRLANKENKTDMVKRKYNIYECEYYE